MICDQDLNLLKYFLCVHIQEIVGAFMNTCMLHYATYRNTFPLWALAEYRKVVFIVN